MNYKLIQLCSYLFKIEIALYIYIISVFFILFYRNCINIRLLEKTLSVQFQIPMIIKYYAT